MKLSYILPISLALSSLAFAEETKRAPSNISSKEALKNLMAGNLRYVENHPLHADSSKERRDAVHQTQNPYAVILGCSDSRVPPEILFDQGIGDLFVVRVAGNVAGKTEIDSIEYAIKHLGASLVLVLGHANCGAVKAAMANELTDVKYIADLIKPALKDCDKVDKCVKGNVVHVVKEIENSSLIGPHVKKDEVEIVGAYYDLTTGKVELLD